MARKEDPRVTMYKECRRILDASITLTTDDRIQALRAKVGTLLDRMNEQVANSVRSADSTAIAKKREFRIQTLYAGELKKLKRQLTDLTQPVKNDTHQNE